MYDPNMPTSFGYRDDEQPVTTYSEQRQVQSLQPCPFCGCRMIRSGLDQPHWQQWWEHEDRETSKCVLKNQTISDASSIYKIAWNTRPLSSHNTQIREVLEMFPWRNNSEGMCWCWKGEHEQHAAFCLAARELWERVQGTREQ